MNNNESTKIKPSEMLFQRLNKALNLLGVSQTELSKRTGIPKGSISQYCSGYVVPKSDRLYLICRALHIQEAWLLGFDVPMRPVFEPLDLKDITEEEKILVAKYRKLSPADKKQVSRQIDGLILLAKEGITDEENI